MNLMTITGVIAGGLLLLCAIGIFWRKKEFPTGGVAVTAIGFVLIGMSQWSNIKISAAGTTIDVLRDMVAETAAAADEVAAQAEQSAAGAQLTQQQLAQLSKLLENKHLLSQEALRPLQTKLESSPRADLNRLNLARTNLEQVRKRLQPVR